MKLSISNSVEGPEFSPSIKACRLKPGYDFGAEFEFGLDLILDGLEAAITAGHQSVGVESRPPTAS